MPRLLEKTLMAVWTNHQRLPVNEKWRVDNGSCGIRTSQRSPMRSDCSSYQPVYRTTLPRMLMHSVLGAGQTATSRTGAPHNQPARAEPDTTCSAELCGGQGKDPIGLFVLYLNSRTPRLPEYRSSRRSGVSVNLHTILSGGLVESFYYFEIHHED